MNNESGLAHTERISVIIPVYNVEQYLDRCISSVLQQSYSKLEVLLVDDGSTDASGLVCDQWAEKDTRIRVIHKTNGGVSDARNAGLDAATGDYIAFVDSDDYISSDMLLKLYRAIQLDNAEMSICSFLSVDETGTPLVVYGNLGLPFKDQVVSGLDILTAVYTAKRGVFYVFAWNKLYKKQLFSNVRFPTGKLSEDTFILCDLLDQCTRVSCINDICYYYVQRTESYMHNRNCRSYMHEAEARLKHVQYFRKRGLLSLAGHAYCDAGLKLQDAIARRILMPECTAELKKVFQLFRQNIECRQFCTTKEKVQISFIYHCPVLFNIIFRNPIRNRAKMIILDSKAKKILRSTLQP